MLYSKLEKTKFVILFDICLYKIKKDGYPTNIKLSLKNEENIKKILSKKVSDRLNKIMKEIFIFDKVKCSIDKKTMKLKCEFPQLGNIVSMYISHADKKYENLFKPVRLKNNDIDFKNIKNNNQLLKLIAYAFIDYMEGDIAADTWMEGDLSVQINNESYDFFPKIRDIYIV